MEIGSIIPYAGATTPENFLECDGSAISRDTYADLFNVIGTVYGAGDGSTTFNLPNLVGRVAIGVSQAHSAGSMGGEANHSLDISEVPEHSHEVPQHGHENTILANTPTLSHTIGQPSYKYTQMNNTSNSAGGGTRASRYTSKTSAAMTRSTNFAVADHPATACTMSGSITDCPAMDSSSTGSGAAHNNMMPYLALTYLIRYAPDVPPGPKMAYYNGALPVGPLGGYISGITR